jgi:hypothetical protein
VASPPPGDAPGDDPCAARHLFALGDRAVYILDSLKNWMAAHSAAIMSVLLLILGVKLIGDAIAGLST